MFSVALGLEKSCNSVGIDLVVWHVVSRSERAIGEGKKEVVVGKYQKAIVAENGFDPLPSGL